MGSTKFTSFMRAHAQVSLPPKDDEIAPGIFNEGTPGPRFFNFSSAPDVEGFNASTCPPSIKWGGSEAFFRTQCESERSPGMRYRYAFARRRCDILD